MVNYEIDPRFLRPFVPLGTELDSWNGGWRRAVVFIQETVPRAAIAWIARAFYNESYRCAPMRHQIGCDADGVRRVSYSWGSKERLGRLEVHAAADAQPAGAETLHEFITEHYWGYSRDRSGGTLEYRVQHPPWKCRPAVSGSVEGDLRVQYGDVLGESLAARPHSALLAEGSPVQVYRPVRIPGD
jgi:uncharacterized protein